MKNKEVNNNMKKLNKQIPALIAAFIITLIVAAGMLFIGGNALFNTNTVAVANSPNQTVNVSSGDPAPAGSQTAQLENLIAQYQQREKQYQAELQQANQQIQQANQQLQQQNQQLSQASQQLQQYQQLISALQQRGIIQIDSQGNVYIPRGGFGDFH